MKLNLSTFDVGIPSSFEGSDYLGTNRTCKAYFKHLHPVYPFLDQADFERRSTSSDLEISDINQKTWSALYHAVLSLGCMYDNGGSFKPAEGLAWHYFRISFRQLQDVLMCRASILKAQVCLSYL